MKTYPSNKKINEYAFSLVEAEMSQRMPQAVREACHKVTAGLDLLIGYYGRYDVFLKSLVIDPEALLIKNNEEKWHKNPLPLRNKIIRSVEAQKSEIYRQLDAMMSFLEVQRGLMAKLSDEKYEQVVALQEEYENA